jgi:hypothetical protein
MLTRAAAILAALLLPGVALAAAPWSAPEPISASHLFIANAGLAYTANGTAVATWGWQDGSRPPAATSGSRVAYKPVGGVWSAERVVRGDLAAPSVTFGRNRWAVPTQTVTAGSRTTIAVVMGQAGRTPDAPKRIFRGDTLARVQLAGNGRGRLALAWQQRAGGRGRVYVALRAPGKPFGRPRIVADGRVRNVAVDVGPRGDVLLAWEERGHVRVRLRGPRAKHFDTARTIASKPAFTNTLRAALTAAGRAYVAWDAQFATEGGSTGPIYVQAAVKPSGGSWRRAQLLDRLGEGGLMRGLALDVVDGDRDAIVAWAASDGTQTHVRTAATGFSGAFDAPRELPGTGGDYTVDDLEDGTLMLTRRFGSGLDTGSQVMASHRLGAPEAVSAEQEAYGGQAAADPAGGVTALWVNRAAGSRHPIAEIRTVVESASRP